MVIHFMHLTVVLLSSLVVSLTCTFSNSIRQKNRNKKAFLFRGRLSVIFLLHTKV